jgi:ERCC4-type nuclease
VHVIVDDRERESPVAHHLAAIEGVSVEVGRLTLGDYLIDDRQMEMLQAIPGIGPGRAHALLARFGGIAALTRASLREVAEVEGFGAKLATRVCWLLRDCREPAAKERERSPSAGAGSEG